VLDPVTVDHRFQLFRGAVRDDLPVVDHRDPVGQLIRFLQVLGREHDRGAAVDQRADRGWWWVRPRTAPPARSGMTDLQWWGASAPVLAWVVDATTFPLGERVGNAAGEEYASAARNRLRPAARAGRIEALVACRMS
jgi:hypothetical protein